MTPVVELVDASFRRGGRIVLSRVTCTVDAGVAMALIGPNGAGKSTMLDGLLGIAPHTASRFVVPTERGAIGMLQQQASVDPAFPITLGQAVMLGRTARLGLRWPGAADRQAVADALDEVGLASLARTRFGDLSGGQQRRGMLARAIVGEPRLLLLDEPFNGLDAASRASLEDAVRRLLARGVACIITTHDLALARSVCATTLLVDGTQLAFGPTEQVLAEHDAAALMHPDGVHHAGDVDTHGRT